MNLRLLCLALLTLLVLSGCKAGNGSISGAFTPGLTGSIQTGPLQIVK